MSQSGITLVLNGKPKAKIVAPSEGPLAYAASELQRYIRQMSKAELVITTDKAEEEIDTIAQTSIVFRISPGAARHDGFSLRVENNDVIIEASEARGCIYGASALLEQLGCRFYGPAPIGTIVPNRGTLTLPATLRILREPAFMNRIASSGKPDEQVQRAFNFTGVARTDETKRLIKRLGLKQYRWGHIWPELTGTKIFADGRNPEKMDYTGHEDWLPADEDGVRRHIPPWHYKEGGQSLCFSNRQAFDWFTENAVNWILTYCRNADYVSMWSADTYQISLCRCDKCVAQFTTDTGQNGTDWYLLIHNEIRRKLNKRGWRKIFGWITYHGSEEPPAHVDLLDNGVNMDFLYAPRPRGGAQHGPLTNDHPISEKYRRNLKGWLDYLKEQNYCGTRTVFEYYYDLVLLGNLAAGRSFLIPKHDVMQEDMQYYHQQGFNGFFDCNPPSNAWFPDPLSRWLYQRLLWDLNLDLEAARYDFYQHYYGPAANQMKEVRETVEKIMFQEPSQQTVDELRTLETKFDTSKYVAGGDDLLLTRIRSMELWVSYCALCKESELHENVTHDYERGRAVEKAIRKLLDDHKDFLVSNSFMSAADVKYVAGEVVERHMRNMAPGNRTP